ncbi:hypothetical protein E4L99_00245 [Lysinibacillus sp. S2017]|uniref:hypothetical protein n=1 Tax=Lysinibacillus sp. 2017 TaxID=2169540 RepID=UPI001092F768|nr:hypothetical protein [Lysinibacillus sp. 2017]TGN36954.1 hypothetical protein E4L99_00245 [Lysinibacillus sp. S2017]
MYEKINVRREHDVFSISHFFSLPFYAFLIWSIKEPVEAQLLFDRWRYKEPPSYSEKQINLFKIGNVFGIIALTLFLISYGLSF